MTTDNTAAATAEKFYTYDEVAELLGTTVDGLYMLVSRKFTPLAPAKKVGREVVFTAATVQAFKEWWEKNEIFRSAAKPPEGPAYNEKEALVYLTDEDGPMPTTTREYFRRRYGMLYPDFYLKGATRGRPRAMYTQESLDKFKQWLAEGKPELRIVSITSSRLLDYMVTFEDGVTLGIRGTEVRITPEVDEDEKQRYLDEFKRKMWRRTVTESRKRALKNPVNNAT